MIRYSFLDVGSSTPCVQPFKQMPLPLAVPIAMAAASIGSSVFNTLSVKANNKKALENQDKLYRQQKEHQDFLNANGALIKRQSMERAGLNPNADYGYSPNLTASTPTPAQLSAPQFNMDMNSVMSILQLMQQKPVSEAQARQINANAEAQEIQNDRERSKDSQSNAYMNNIMSNSSLFGEGYNDVVSADLDGGELSNVSVKGKGKKFNYGDFEFYRITKQFDNELKQFSYNDAKWSLEKMVIKAQGEDKDVLQSIISLPKGQLEQLTSATKLAVEQASTSQKQGQLFDAQAAFINLQKKIQEESTLSQIFDDMMKKGLSPENVGRMLIACFVNFFKSSVSFSF